MNSPHARAQPRRDSLGAKRDRLRIAQVAARLIAEHGLTDWTLAKRKAVRQLLLPDSVPLPSNDEIEAALTEHHALFGGDAHVAALRRQRVEALSWMRRLARWEPVLVGGVAEGWATEHSDVRLELVADDPKTLEIELAGHGVTYAALPPREGDATTVLRVESRGGRGPAVDRHPDPAAQSVAQARRATAYRRRIGCAHRRLRLRRFRALRARPRPSARSR
jgi:hypothetical protein